MYVNLELKRAINSLNLDGTNQNTYMKSPKIANGVQRAEVSGLVRGSRAHVTFRTKRMKSVNPTNDAKRTLYKNACKNNSYNYYKTYKTCI